MKSSAIRALLFCPLAWAAAVGDVAARQDEASTECCFLWGTLGHNYQVFRTHSAQLSQQARGEPTPWCIVEIKRDPIEPNNCAAATASTIAGYCGYGEVAVNVDCASVEQWS